MDLFRRRVKVLLLSFVILWLLLVARLAQIQIGGHHRFDLQRYTRAGGNRLLDTVRGGIYGYWGTPLAVQVPSFDVGVHYSRLLTSCSEPWERADVRALIDEYLKAASAAGPAAGRQARDYRALWARRDAAAPYGSVASYVRRRLAGESKRRIARGDPPTSRQADWRPVVARLAGRSVEELTAAADDVVTRVERVEALVRRRQMEREGKADIRIAERYRWHVVAEDVPGDVAAVIRTEAERFPSVEVRRRPVPAVRMITGSRRRYSSGRLAPHVVGHGAPIDAERWARLNDQGRTWRVGQPLEDAGRRYTLADRTGVLGVEKAAEEELRGRRGYVQNRLEFGYLSYKTVSEVVPPERGHDVYLTIHEDLQSAANDALAWAADRELNPELDFSAGALVLVDVRSGAVLAAATWPSYDLATFREDFERLNADPHYPLLFRPTQAALPTGSVYKVITAIAALEEGAIRPETAFPCAQREVFRAGGHSRAFTCVGLHGEMTLVPAIEKSCNIYFYHTGLKAGGEALARWGRAFGLGVPTGVDLPYAKDGQLPEPKYTFGVLNLSIGQGDLLCTPLQVAGAMAAVANGGKLYRPHFIARVCDASGEVVRATGPQFVPVPVKESTLNVVREGMRRVVETGTARRAGLERFRAAGKTGTAERGKGRPNHAWFAGYAPYDDPKIAFAVVSENTSKHGGSGAAPILAHCLEEVWDAIEQMP